MVALPEWSLGKNKLPAAVQNLIEHHLHSASDVDALLLLHRVDRGWTAAGVSKELRLNIDQANSILARLSRTGLLREEGDSFRFQPRDPALAEAVAVLAALYPAYRFAVVSLIYPPGGPARDFSEAFRLRKED